ncbi:MAG: hypothetical protein A2920_00755 [Candidatus Zambryskibacteria bacterium RIFCSPLOWO2_01_FULL_43_17]|uniref:Uncharacterized protein n=1 Tax=Candidatus Zambryskibacteria bacterium RIFCSPLOWO2_01_FULL_43_17 TaxID=1802760 RepID=A0A1G2U3Z1_9BACT|nr:MAG: hypothetical protein A2920_00755 [Candidatus Zambryskibacteria bacterium RIFCSPLOWO2_01_FULL_43_17]
MLPVHPPEALQLVAFVDDQLRVEAPPDATLVGEADRVTVGGGFEVTVTVAEAFALPPGPVHVKVNVVLLVSAPVDWLPPETGDFDPVQFPFAGEAEALQLVVLVDVHVRVEAPPEATLVGEADRVTAGPAHVEGAVALTFDDVVVTGEPLGKEAVTE